MDEKTQTISKPPIILRVGLRAATRRLHASPLVTFIRAIMANPRSMGAFCPSSKILARALADQVCLAKKGLVIELGAGTGVVTQALLNRGLHPERLIVIERDRRLALFLSKRFPQITIIHGDACKLEDLLGEARQDVAAIVSSLPLVSLPQSVVQTIGAQLNNIMHTETELIQFTYHLFSRKHLLPQSLGHKSKKHVWHNFPPARINVFQKHSLTTS